MNDLKYEQLIRTFLSFDSYRVLSLFNDEVLIFDRDQFYGGELYITLNDDDSYAIHQASPDIDFENDKVIVESLSSLKEAVKKLTKINNKK